MAYIAPNYSTVTSAYIQFDPNSAPVIRSGLQLWLRNDFGVLTSGTGSNVNTWVDLSGSGNDATQATLANQPSLVGGAINGFPAVTFNGTSNWLQLPAGFASYSGGSFFVIAKPITVTAGARLFDLGNGATSDNINMQLPNTTQNAFYIYNGATASSVTGSSAINLNRFQLLEAIDSGTNATVYTNGAVTGTSTTMKVISNLSRANCFIGQSSGSGKFFSGQIAEILFYNSNLTASQQAGLEAYAAQKYQISSQVPTAPVFSAVTSTFKTPGLVAIAANPLAQIRMTRDGTTPTASSQLYYQPVNISSTQTLKAIAIINGISSSVTTATISLDPVQNPAPAIDSRSLQIELQTPTVSQPQ